MSSCIDATMYGCTSSNTFVDSWMFYGDYGGNGMENVSFSLSSLIVCSGISSVH